MDDVVMVALDGPDTWLKFKNRTAGASRKWQRGLNFRIFGL
jgi:hypothetical protein